MEVNTGKFEKGVKWVNKMVLRYLVVILSLCIVLGAAHLTIIIVQKTIEPPYALLEVTSLLEVFSLALIIVVGYELIKSISIIISSESIPIIPIVQIALTAIANKIITLDIKKVDSAYLFGIAAITLALSASLFFINYKKERQL